MQNPFSFRDELTSCVESVMNNRLPLPKGKLTVRHRQMRNVFQVFAGNKYLDGASGDNEEEALQALANQYDVKAGQSVDVFGYKEPSKAIIPEPE